MEAAEHPVREQLENIDRAAAQAASPADLVRSYVRLARESLVASDYREGCALAPLVIESAGELGDVGDRGFSAIIDRLASHLAALGVDSAAARRLAAAMLAGMEGALVTARALRSPEPFEAVSALLESQVAVL